MSLIPKYEEVTRKPNPMRNRNPLSQTEAKGVGLVERRRELTSYKKWQKLIAEYREQGIKIAVGEQDRLLENVQIDDKWRF